MKITNYEVVGYKPVSYTNKSGRKVEGFITYLQCVDEVEGVFGTETAEVWQSSEMRPSIGDVYQCVRFNGKVMIVQ